MDWNVPDDSMIPDEITVSLKQNGEVVDTQTVTAKDDWTYEWEGLLKYVKDEEGNTEEVLYEVEAEQPDGFETVVDGYDVQNIIVGTVGMEGQVTWEDEGNTDQLRPEAITAELYREGDDESVGSVQISAENDWKYQFEDLAQYSEDGLEAYSYYVGITAPEGYEVMLEDGQIVACHEVIQTEAETETETETEVVTEAVTETETEVVTEVETETETEVVTEAVTEAETEVVAEAITETETEVITEVETETETEVVTETVTETETEAVTEAETEAAETEDAGDSAKEEKSIVVPVGIGLIILLIIFLFERARRKANK